MPKYVLSIKKGKEFYEIPWGKKYNIGNSTTLEGIDLFTSNFNNKDELKEELIKKGLLSLNDYTKEIRITYRNGGITKLVKRDFIYSDTKEYLSFDCLLAHIIESIKDYETNENGISYIKKLINHFQGTYNKVDLNYLLQTATNLDENNHLMPKQLDMFIARLSRFLYNETHHNGNLSYKPLHDLATYIIFLNNNLEHKQSIEDKNSRKLKKELDGQLSLY